MVSMLEDMRKKREEHQKLRIKMEHERRKEEIRLFK